MADGIERFFVGETAIALVESCQATGVCDTASLAALHTEEAKNVLKTIAEKAVGLPSWPLLKCGEDVSAETKKEVNLMKAKRLLVTASKQVEEGMDCSLQKFMETAYERLGGELPERMVISEQHVRAMGKDPATYRELKITKGATLDDPDWRETTEGKMVATKKVLESRTPRTVSELIFALVQWVCALSTLVEDSGALLAGLNYISRICKLADGRNDSDIIIFDTEVRKNLASRARSIAREQKVAYHRAIVIALSDVMDPEAYAKVLTSGGSTSSGSTGKRGRDWCVYYYGECPAMLTRSCEFTPAQHMNRPGGKAKGAKGKGKGKGKAKGYAKGFAKGQGYNGFSYGFGPNVWNNSWSMPTADTKSEKADKKN
ncbi:hypothetical protein FOZ62_005434 [Perkinsus olseni]|uniref:Uncharacterized protein n=1 Tax=Perkinsus olseni TaxID=32597 RepID=A0A7J6Q538_PEROL|nr:hypothetical protein FOZ62_005434 [Perkinsus olseni]